MNGRGALLTGLALLAIGLLGCLIYPFASALLFAAVLAGALHPQFERLAARLGGRPAFASGLVTAAVGVLLVAPTIWLGFTIGRQTLAAAAEIDRTLRREGGLPALIERLPSPLREHAQTAVEHVPGGTDQLQDLAADESGRAAAALPAALVAAAALTVNVALMLVAFFFFLVDGKPLVQWIASVAPLPDGQILDILHDFRIVSVAVLLSSLATAGAQSLAALAGYYAAGVPQPLFFGLVTFIVAFVPALGATSVVLCLAALLLVTGRAQEALYLALWGVFVVHFIDNLVKPWLLRGRTEIHGGLIFFALVGGLASFGPIGLVAGPLILSFFLAVVRLCRKEPRRMAA